MRVLDLLRLHADRRPELLVTIKGGGGLFCGNFHGKYQSNLQVIVGFLVLHDIKSYSSVIVDW